MKNERIRLRSSNDFQHRLISTMEGLKANLDAILEDIPADAPLAYLDPPIHLNVGDLLINLGTERFLADHGRHVSVRLSVKDYERFADCIREEHVLVFHGGGNFGDIWPAHERMRQDLMRRFPRNKMVVLPQTVHFNDLTRIDEFAAAYRKRPDCVIYVRDRRSYGIIMEKFRVPCKLSPDMAHHLWCSDGEFMPSATGLGELVFMRKDREAADDQADRGLDWDDLIGGPSRLACVPWYAGLRFSPLSASQPFFMRKWYERRDAIIRRAIEVFKNYERIRTDRLHAIILGSLLGKPVTMHDNSYGKLSSYSDVWLPGLVDHRI